MFRVSRSLTANGSGIYEGREIEAEMFSFALQFDRSTNVDFITFSPPFINTMLAAGIL